MRILASTGPSLIGVRGGCLQGQTHCSPCQVLCLGSLLSIWTWDFFSSPFSLFLISSPKLSYFVDGPRVRLGLGRGHRFVLESCGYMSVSAHPHIPPKPVHGPLSLPLRNSVCFVISVSECICLKCCLIIQSITSLQQGNKSQ